MKMRLGYCGFLGIAIATLGLTLGCTDDSDGDGGGDAGLEAGAGSEDDVPDPTDEEDDGTPTDTDGDPPVPTASNTVPMPTMSGDPPDPPECEEDATVICDDNDRVRIDVCEMSGPTVIETCEDACELGRCVECAVSAGVICEDGNVHRVDSCGNAGVELELCSNGCSNGACIEENCEPDAMLECVGNLLFSVDSCGNQTNIEDVCEAGCVDGACVGCTNDGETLCYAGDIYPVDSCGQTGDALEECTGTCSVTEVEGVSTAACSDVVCEPTTDTECFKGDLYAVDSCGGIVDEVVTDCHNGCDEDGCLACVPAPVGVVCFAGDVYDTLGGCDAPLERSETVKEECEFGCFNGMCAEAGECVPEGTTCSDGDVHAIDSCGEVGELVEDCTAGCDEGSCLDEVVDGGPGVPDAGPDAGPDPAVDAGGDDTSATDPVDAGDPTSDEEVDAGDAGDASAGG